MITCTRRIEFDAAHRLINHEGKCRMFHGHRYVVEVTFGADNLDNVGRVIDFGNVKEILGQWIEENFDHNAILNAKDKELGDFVSKKTGQKIYYLEENPTVENIAKHLFYDVAPQLFAGFDAKIIKIKIFETPNCSSEIHD